MSMPDDAPRSRASAEASCASASRACASTSSNAARAIAPPASSLRVAIAVRVRELRGDPSRLDAARRLHARIRCVRELGALAADAGARVVGFELDEQLTGGDGVTGATCTART